MASTNNYPFVCPSCGSHNLQVSCEITCAIVQEGDGDFETRPVNGDYYFDSRSFTACWDCEYEGEVRDFEVPNTPIEENPHDCY